MALNKYASQRRFQIQSMVDLQEILGSSTGKLSEQVETAAAELLNAALEKSTWGKYSSAMNTFACFEAASCEVYEWPLDVQVCRSFVVWCYRDRSLQPTTIRAYLSAVKFVHSLKGMSSAHITGDPILALLLKGAAHMAMQNFPNNNTRRVVTFPMLLLLGHRISLTTWTTLTKQVVFTACTTGFYASTRMGEILASREFSHAPLSDLTWADVKESSDTSLLLRLKQPKSGEQAEFVDLSPFPGYQCCPVAAIRELKALQQKEACFDLDKPVFRFKNGRNLTQTNLNAILGNLLQDLCKPGENSVSCHSFRAGIPSTLSLFPHLVADDMIKGWGRWHSECYQKYMRLKLPQKEKNL